MRAAEASVTQLSDEMTDLRLRCVRENELCTEVWMHSTPILFNLSMAI